MDGASNNSQKAKELEVEVCCDRRELKLKEAEKTIANKDVIIQMLQCQVKKLENSYKQNLEQTEAFRYKFYLASEQMKRLRQGCLRTREKPRHCREAKCDSDKCDSSDREPPPSRCKYLQQIKNVEKAMNDHNEMLKTVLSRISSKMKDEPRPPETTDTSDLVKKIAELQDEISRLKEENTKMQQSPSGCEESVQIPTIRDSLLDTYRRTNSMLFKKMSILLESAEQEGIIFNVVDDEALQSPADIEGRKVSFPLVADEIDRLVELKGADPADDDKSLLKGICGTNKKLVIVGQRPRDGETVDEMFSEISSMKEKGSCFSERRLESARASDVGDEPLQKLDVLKQRVEEILDKQEHTHDELEVLKTEVSNIRKVTDRETLLEVSEEVKELSEKIDALLRHFGVKSSEKDDSMDLCVQNFGAQMVESTPMYQDVGSNEIKETEGEKEESVANSEGAKAATESIKSEEIAVVGMEKLQQDDIQPKQSKEAAGMVKTTCSRPSCPKYKALLEQAKIEEEERRTKSKEEEEEEERRGSEAKRVKLKEEEEKAKREEEERKAAEAERARLEEEERRAKIEEEEAEMARKEEEKRAFEAEKARLEEEERRAKVEEERRARIEEEERRRQEEERKRQEEEEARRRQEEEETKRRQQEEERAKREEAERRASEAARLAEEQEKETIKSSECDPGDPECVCAELEEVSKLKDHQIETVNNLISYYNNVLRLCQPPKDDLQGYIEKVRDENIKLRSTISAVIENLNAKINELKAARNQESFHSRSELSCHSSDCVCGPRPDIEDVYRVVRRTLTSQCQPPVSSSGLCVCHKINTKMSYDCCSQEGSTHDSDVCPYVLYDKKSEQIEAEIVESCSQGDDNLVSNLESYLKYLNEQLRTITAIENRIADLRANMKTS